VEPSFIYRPTYILSILVPGHSNHSSLCQQDIIIADLQQPSAQLTHGDKKDVGMTHKTNVYTFAAS